MNKRQVTFINDSRADAVRYMIRFCPDQASYTRLVPIPRVSLRSSLGYVLLRLLMSDMNQRDLSL